MSKENLPIKQIKKTFTRQHDQSDCGVACLLSIVRYYKGEGELEYYRELSGTAKEGTTLLGLKQAAERLGFEAEGCEADISALIAHDQPVILHVVINDHLSHYVVCYGYSDGQFLIGDPGKGVEYLSAEVLDKVWISKKCLTLSPNEQFQTKHQTNQSKLRWIKSLIKEDAGLLFASVAIGIGMTILGLSMALFKKKLVDNILPDKNLEGLFIGIVAIAILLLLKSGLTAMRSMLVIEQSKQFNLRITNSFLTKLLYLPKPFFDTRKVGDFVARLNDTTRIQRVISQLISNTIIDAIVAVVTISFLYFFSWQVGVLASVGISIYFVIIYRHNSQIVSSQKAVMTRYASNESHYIDIINGIADIKSYNQHDAFLNANHKIFGNFQESIFHLGKLNIKLSLLAGVVSTLLTLSILGQCAYQVIIEQMQLGSLIAIMGVTMTLIPSVASLAMVSIPLNEAKVAFDRMFAFSALSSNPKEKDSSIKEIEQLSLNDISFSFVGRDTLLESISMQLNKGTFTTLLGESGNGKSTLLQILQKFYSYEYGEVLINNEHNLAQISHAYWNNRVSIVPQQVHVFNGTILSNITLTSEKSDWDEAWQMCEQLGIGQYINKLPQGYTTIVGSGGVNLSGGQRQLVALARALYHKPQLLLLDEATSAMDRNTENFILELLQKLKKDMMILMVTHRIKTASKSDYIYILEDKTITHQGTPSELMLTDNFYSQAFNELVQA